MTGAYANYTVKSTTSDSPAHPHPLEKFPNFQV